MRWSRYCSEVTAADEGGDEGGRDDRRQTLGGHEDEQGVALVDGEHADLADQADREGQDPAGDVDEDDGQQGDAEGPPELPRRQAVAATDGAGDADVLEHQGGHRQVVDPDPEPPQSGDEGRHRDQAPGDDRPGRRGHHDHHPQRDVDREDEGEQQAQQEREADEPAAACPSWGPTPARGTAVARSRPRRSRGRPCRSRRSARWPAGSRRRPARRRRRWRRRGPRCRRCPPSWRRRSDPSRR